MTMTHQEVAKHFRKRLKAAGIKARCRIYSTCGTDFVQVSTPEYGKHFTPNQLKEIGIIAQVNGMTGAYGMPIDLDIIVQMTRKDTFDFEYRP